MKSKFLALLYLSFGLIFTGCSWQEYFVVSNSSDETIFITYHLKESKTSGLPIFHVKPEAYGLTKKGNIDYDNKLNLVDSDSSLYYIKVELKPNTIMIFGNLSNDNYTTKDQYFINGRIFNFSMMEIEKGAKTTRITFDNFDSFFAKKDGKISYNIQ